MLDRLARRLVDPPLVAAGRRLAKAGVKADHLTWLGFGAGMAACLALALQFYPAALLLIVVNRLLDGLDGPVARAGSGATDFGGYLDIVLDFLFYAAAPVAFAAGRPDAALVASLLVLSFVGTGTSFLAFAILATKRGLRNGPRSFFYLGGLAEGTETALFLLAICVWPERFAWIAVLFMALCWATVAGRVLAAARAFR